MRGTSTPAVAIWGVTLFSLAFVAFVSWLDALCILELWFPLRFFALAFYLLSTLAFLRWRTTRVIAAGSVGWMLVFLPQVRWNEVKSFYVDARRIESGMTASEVRQIMARHMEVGVSYHPTPKEQDWLPRPPDPTKGMIFLHSVVGWTDHCEVWLDSGGRVRDIHIEKD
ncbi:MAG: hypothetical protein HOP15_16005 [Planctomycetes bacterium]|nr:hypothetical protein [Planctomycetota bacterium]